MSAWTVEMLLKGILFEFKAVLRREKTSQYLRIDDFVTSAGGETFQDL